MRRHHCLILAASLVLTGCQSATPDLSQLPEDALERATLCFGSARIFRLAAQRSGAGAAEIERRGAIEEKLRRATEIDRLVRPARNLDVLEPEIDRILNGGNWLISLNRCIEAYRIGAQETVPGLPEEPLTRLHFCAIGTAYLNREDRQSINPYYDSQGFHFIMQAAKRFGADASQQMAAATSPMIQTIVRQGAVESVVERCVAEHPLAALDHRTELPRRAYLRAEICELVSEVVTEDSPANGLRARYMPRALRMSAPIEAVLYAPVPAHEEADLQQPLHNVVADLGPSTSIFSACERAFLDERPRASDAPP